MRQNQKLLVKSKKLWVVTKETAQEDVKPLLHRWEGEKLLTSALDRQEGIKLLENDIPRQNQRKRQ